MNKLLLLVLTLILFQFPSIAQQVTFEKWYDYGFAEAGYCVQQTPDSGYIVAGRQGIWFFSSKMLFIKTDKYGNTEWTTLLGDGSNDSYAYYIINCSAGGYAAVGYLTGSGFVRDIYVVRLDNNGDTLWTKQYGTTAIEEGTCIQETDNGDFVISFRAADSSGIFKIDSLGNLIWWKSYNFSNGGHFKNLALLSSGNYLLAGVMQTSVPLYSQGILMMTDSIGDSLWVKTYGGIGGDEFFEAHETYDNNIIVAGISSKDINSPYGSFILKVNLTGDTIWSRQFLPEYSAGFVSVHTCFDGGFIACGTSYDINVDGSLFITKINQFGDSIWTKTIGGIDDDHGYFIRQAFDTGYIVAGMTSSWNPVDVYLVKTDSLGNLITGIFEIDFSGLDFNIYPNPTRNFIIIKSNEEIDKLQLFDAEGRILIINALNKTKETTIDLSGFGSGVYYLHMQTAKGVGVRKVIKL